MGEMPSLPPELLLIVFSFLDSGDLWAVAQASRGFQSLALSPLFTSHNVSAAQIDSGVVSLSGRASFLVPRIYAIQPIQKLTILPGSLSLNTLTSILAAKPEIADVTISFSTANKSGLGTIEAGNLIAPLCLAKDPAIFLQIHNGTGHIGISLPRFCFQTASYVFRSPIVSFPLSNDFDLLTNLINFVGAILLILSTLFLIPISLLRAKSRIAAILPMAQAQAVHVQATSIPGVGRFIQSTFGHTPLRELCIHSHCYLWVLPAQQKAFFTALHLGDTLETVILREYSGVSFGPVLGFISRHPSIRKLQLEPGSLHFASLTAGSLCTETLTISSLTAPAVYMPYIRHAVSAVENLAIIFDLQLRYGAYVRALTAIEPAWPLHTVTLDFPPFHLTIFPNALPWRADADAGVEALLYDLRVLRIPLSSLIAADVEPLVRWLTRFPALVELQLYPGPMVPIVEPILLAEFIAEAMKSGSRSYDGQI